VVQKKPGKVTSPLPDLHLSPVEEFPPPPPPNIFATDVIIPPPSFGEDAPAQFSPPPPVFSPTSKVIYSAYVPTRGNLQCVRAHQR